MDIRSLILHLLESTKKNNPQQLKSKYDAVEQVPYTINELIGVIVLAVEDLVEIGELAGRPYSPNKVSA